MDPNTMLDDLRRLAHAVIDRPGTDEARELAALVSALDESLSKGEALPAAWERAGLRTGLAQLQQILGKALDNPDLLAFDQGLD